MGRIICWLRGGHVWRADGYRLAYVPGGRRYVERCIRCPAERTAGQVSRHQIGARHYPSYAPAVLWNRTLHKTVLGPLLGCSCTRCFKHPWRLYYWREGVRDRLRIARLEERVRELEDA